MRRGTLPILGVLAVITVSPASAVEGADRLVEACQVAVATHAEAALDFPTGSRSGDEVRLGFSFVNAERVFSGNARCVFRASPIDAFPPSLIDLEVMGRITPGRFLMSHHAVWVFLTGEPEQTAGEHADPPPAGPVEDSSGRRMRAAAEPAVRG